MAEAVQGAQAVSRALGVLRAVARAPEAGITLAQLTRDTGLNKPTAHRLVLALAAEGMVQQDTKSLRYHLGPECYVLGVVAKARFGPQRCAADAVVRLARASGDSAFFSLRSDVQSVCVLREDGDFPLKTHVLQPGIRHPLGVGAGSLAMLAALDDSEVERCLAANAGELADHYPAFSVEGLRADVARTRQRGYSVNEGSVVAGSWGIGAPVHAAGGEVVGALSIAAVESRLQRQRQEELGALLVREARWVEAQIRRAETSRAGVSPARAPHRGAADA